eukprot:4003349-Pleurochrysis_carterae.AAC.1
MSNNAEHSNAHAHSEGESSVAEGAVGASVLLYIPRFETSWSESVVRSDLVDHCLRPRPSAPLDDDTSKWLHKQLITAGHEENKRGHHLAAHSWFECAYCISGSALDLISSINMRLKFGQCHMAKALYQRVLEMDVGLTEEQLQARRAACSLLQIRALR